MKKEEFINWIIENNIILKEYEIYPDKYTNVPFSSGCYTDKEGNWYYYHHIDERTSLIPNGQKMSEDECFEKLLKSLKYEIEQKNTQMKMYEEELQRSYATISLEEKEKKEKLRNAYKEEKELMDLYVVKNQFANSKDDVVIDISKIYKTMDCNTEGNSLYIRIKELYKSLYSEEMVEKLFKIYKYQEKYSRYMKIRLYGGCYNFIYEKINGIFQNIKENAECKMVEDEKRIREEVESLEKMPVKERIMLQSINMKGDNESE